MANECNYSDSVIHHVWQELTSEDKEYAATHLNETDEIRENTVVEIRCWIEDELRVRIDDFFILRFLRVCKFNLKNTKTRMRNYYKHRSNLPDWYMNKDPFRPELQEILDRGLVLPLRKPDNRRRLVFIIRPTRHDPTIHKLFDFIKIGGMLAELIMRDNAVASVYGCTVFIDAVKPTVRHLALCQPHILMNVMHSFQSCYPIKIQSINVINASIFVNTAIRLMKSFMMEEMKNGFQVYRHMQNCFKDVPANILPIEYGGTDGTIQELADYWKKVNKENRDWLMSAENDKIE